MAQDGFSLDDKRQPVDANDIPDIQDCWQQRNDAQFAENREKRIGALRAELEPLKKERLQLDAELNRLTFDLALASAMDESAASELDVVKAQRATLDARIATPQAELDQLTRQFWVDAEAVRQKKYDLSASRYRQTDPDESYHESPQVTLERLARLEQVMTGDVHQLTKTMQDRVIFSEKWKLVEFGKVAHIISGYGFKRSEYSSSGVKLLQIANVSFQEIVWDNLAYLPVDYLEQYPNLVLQKGDLLIALNRPILGNKIKFSFLKSQDAPSILYQRVGKIVVDNTKLSSEYLFGFMLTEYFYNELKKRLTGSDQPYINPTELVKIKIPLPPLEQQIRLSKILRKYNELTLKQREAKRQVDIFLQSILAEEFCDYPAENI